MSRATASVREGMTDFTYHNLQAILAHLSAFAGCDAVVISTEAEEVSGQLQVDLVCDDKKYRLMHPGLTCKGATHGMLFVDATRAEDVSPNELGFQLFLSQY